MSKLILTIFCIIISTFSLNLDDVLTYYTLNIGKVYTNGNNSITLVKADKFIITHNYITDTVGLIFDLEFKAHSAEKIEILTVGISAVKLK
jgi:hypothetical protein